MRSLIVASAICLLLTCSLAASAQNTDDQKTTTIVGTTSVVQVAQPDDKVVINGRIFTVSEVMAVTASSDSSREQRLRNQEKQSREGSKQDVQLPQQGQSCLAGSGSALNPACAGTPSTAQDHPAKPQQ